MIDKERWLRQLRFNQRFFIDKLGKDMSELTLEEKQIWTQKYLLHIVKEITEVLDEINFKMHRKEEKPVILSNILEELIDNLKFILGLFQLWGFTYEEVMQGFDDKSTVVEQRYQQEHELNLIDSAKPIACIDLDGIIFDYPKCFIDWAYNAGYIDMRYNSTHEMKHAIGLIKWEEIKDSYRQSGIKSKLPVKHGVINFLEKLRKNGYQIIGLTARPYKQYSRIYHDTLKNLKLFNIKLDAIFWDDNKCLKILKSFPNISFFLDDDLKQVNSVAELGYKVFWFPDKNEYNKEVVTHNNVIRIDDFNSILENLGI